MATPFKGVVNIDIEDSTPDSNPTPGRGREAVCG